MYRDPVNIAKLLFYFLKGLICVHVHVRVSMCVCLCVCVCAGSAYPGVGVLRGLPYLCHPGGQVLQGVGRHVQRLHRPRGELLGVQGEDEGPGALTVLQHHWKGRGWV